MPDESSESGRVAFGGTTSGFFLVAAFNAVDCSGKRKHLLSSWMPHHPPSTQHSMGEVSAYYLEVEPAVT